MRLSKAEEQLMRYLWKREKAYLKDLLEEFPDPKPASTTVATLLKRMADKGYVGYTIFGSNREYYAKVEQKDYFSTHLKGLIKNFFNDSASQFASFFASESNLTVKELEELKKLVDEQLKKKKQ